MIQRAYSRADPFHILRKTLVFEDNSNKKDKNDTQQNDNAESTDSLDDELNKVREQRDTGKKASPDGDTTATPDTTNEGEGENEGDEDLSLDTPETPDGETSDTSLGSPEGDTTGGGMGGSSGMSQSTDTSGGMGTDPMDEKPQNPIGQVNRKYSLYTEYTRIIVTLNKSIETLSNISIDNKKIKASISRLKDVYEDGMYIINKFKEYSEADLMIHLELIKKRSSIIIKHLKRLQEEQEDGKKS